MAIKQLVSDHFGYEMHGIFTYADFPIGLFKQILISLTSFAGTPT